MARSSTNSDRHPYLRGHSFWSQNAFWRTNEHCKKAQDYYESWLNDMRVKERNLMRLGGN